MCKNKDNNIWEQPSHKKLWESTVGSLKNVMGSLCPNITQEQNVAEDYFIFWITPAR